MGPATTGEDTELGHHNSGQREVEGGDPTPTHTHYYYPSDINYTVLLRSTHPRKSESTECGICGIFNVFYFTLKKS